MHEIISFCEKAPKCTPGTTNVIMCYGQMRPKCTPCLARTPSTHLQARSDPGALCKDDHYEFYNVAEYCGAKPG